MEKRMDPQHIFTLINISIDSQISTGISLQAAVELKNIFLLNYTEFVSNRSDSTIMVLQYFRS